MELNKACSVEKAAEMLGVTPALVRRYCRQERIKAQMFGGSWVIELKSLTNFAKIPRNRGRHRISEKSQN